MPSSSAVRIALDHGAVHERAGVAFVGVADQVLLVARPASARTSTSCRSGSRRRRGRAARCARPGRTPRRASARAAPWPGPRSRRARCTRRSAPGRSMPQLASTQRVCGAKNGCSSRTARRPTAARASVVARNWPERRRCRRERLPAKTASSRPSTCFSVTRWKLRRGAAGQLHVHQRFFDAQADAADLDDVRVDVRRRSRYARMAAIVLAAPAPRPQVPVPTKIAGRASVSRRSRALRAARAASARVALVAQRSGREALDQLRARPRRARASTRRSRVRRRRRVSRRSFLAASRRSVLRIFVARSEVTPAWNSPLTRSPGPGRRRRCRPRLPG